MIPIGSVTTGSSDSASLVEILAVGLLGAFVAVLAGRALVLRITGRIRRSDLASAEVVSEIVTSAVAGEDPDMVVMRAAFELKRLLDLADCQWAWQGDQLPTATLADDGSIRFGTYRWPTQREGLPPRGVRRALIANGRSFGWIVLVPDTEVPVPAARMRSAVTTIDVLALCLDQHRHPAIPGRSV